MTRSDQTPELRFRWSPKVRPDKIWRLYHNDAKGIVDEVLIDDVGLALLLRCQSILMVTEGKAKCPHCGHTMQFTAESAARCPGCGYGASWEQFHASWRHRKLYGGNAVPAFREFVDQYEHARSARDRLILIDRLIHAFHYGLRSGLGRCAVENLIEGNKKQVLALLDGLTYGEASAPETKDTKDQWRNVLRHGADPPGKDEAV